VSFFILGLGAASAALAQGGAEAGAQVYVEMKCAKCHGEAGKGDGATAIKVKAEMKDWTDQAVMAEITDDYMEEIITKGGKAIGKSKKMPRYEHKLSAEQIKDLVAYTRSIMPE
jgi:mono/diheme cytochrome c family protein